MMNWKNNKKKITGIAAAVLFTLTGTYNAVVINADSSMNGSNFKFVKRLDEIYGVVTPGRQVAASVQWQKLEKKQMAKTLAVVQTVNMIDSSSKTESAPAAEAVTAAAVQEELQLNLVEVVNPRKWANALTATQFNGSLSTNNGVIESLSVSLPNGEGVSVSFSEMNGNVFEYELDGELYSGMMYQVDQYSYMVTLTNGPMEGTRMRFSTASTETQVAEAQEQLAENHNIEAGSFGQDVQPESLVQNDQAMQAEAQAAQTFNMGQENI